MGSARGEATSNGWVTRVTHPFLLGACAALALVGPPAIATGVIDSATLEARYASSPSKFLMVDGVRLHVRDEGRGPALLLLNVTVLREEAPVVSDVATLANEQAQAALVVTADRERKLLRVRVLAAAPPAPQQVLQLWAVSRDGQPRSLGVLGRSQELTLPLPANAIGGDVAMLAVSLEPIGGSPDPKGPSGPILYKGSWVRLM